MAQVDHELAGRLDLGPDEREIAGARLEMRHEVKLGVLRDPTGGDGQLTKEVDGRPPPLRGLPR